MRKEQKEKLTQLAKECKSFTINLIGLDAIQEENPKDILEGELSLQEKIKEQAKYIKNDIEILMKEDNYESFPKDITNLMRQILAEVNRVLTNKSYLTRNFVSDQEWNEYINSDDVIAKLIEIGKSGVNAQPDEYFKDNENFMLRLIQGKVLVDRWNNVTSVIMFNPKHRNFVNNEIEKYYRERNYGTFDGKTLWGADLMYSDVVQEDRILLVGVLDRLDETLDFISPNYQKDLNELDHQIDEGRAVALIPMVQL